MIPGFFQGTEMLPEGWWGTLWPDPARVLTSLGLKPGMRVVDLCCGDGWSCSPFRFPSHASPPPRPRSARARRGRRSLRRVGNLRSDRGAMQYYNGARTHLALNKDAPVPRAVQVVGRILSTDREVRRRCCVSDPWRATPSVCTNLRFGKRHRNRTRVPRPKRKPRGRGAR